MLSMYPTDGFERCADVEDDAHPLDMWRSRSLLHAHNCKSCLRNTRAVQERLFPSRDRDQFDKGNGTYT